MSVARRWAVPDGWMPDGETAGVQGHEAICVLNLSEQDAALSITIFFEDRPPQTIEGLACGARRTRHFRLDRAAELNGYVLAFETPYAALVESDVAVVVQHTRVDPRGGSLALMTTTAVALPEEAGR